VTLLLCTINVWMVAWDSTVSFSDCYQAKATNAERQMSTGAVKNNFIHS